jgi:two-component system, sensor histidine kinase
LRNTHLSRFFSGLRITAPPLWIVVALPLGFFAAAVASLSAFGTDTPIWVSNAFAVTALLRNKRSSWPVLLILAAAADTAAGALSNPPLLALGIAGCDFCEILFVALLVEGTGITALAGGIWAMASLALICLAVPVVSSTAGTLLLMLFYGVPFWTSWIIWYLATAFGLLMVVPFLLSWTDPALRIFPSRAAIAQVAALAALTGGVGYVTFIGGQPDGFMAFPFLMLATFNGRLLGATTATVTLAAVAIWCTMTGHVPSEPMAHLMAVGKIQLLQLYIVTLLLSTLPVAAFLEQRERLLAQLRESTKAAEAAGRAKSEFVAVMSHEIRTPMTGVLGMADLLSNADLPAKEREYVAGIQTSGRHLLALINDVLDFSRIEAGKLELESVEFGLPEMLEQVRSLLAPEAALRGLDLCFDLEVHSSPVLCGDPTRLKQVLVNLVWNGIKFTPKGSVSVTVNRCAPEDHAGKDYAGKNKRGRFRFEVRDTGIGVAADRQAILFQAFSQADSSMTRQYGGSGLGLAICKNLVQAMGGEMGVESVLGIGSRFWFEVSLGVSERTSIPAKAADVLVETKSRRVLLVEDVELNQVLITDMLRVHGHDVTLAKNGMEAVDLAMKEAFDLVLMDVQMPVMDGVEATRRIRRLPPPAGEVPVFALSANVMAAEQARCIAAGMNGALTKPVDWRQLFDALARYGGSGQKPADRADRAGPGASADTPIDLAVLAQLQDLQGQERGLTLKLAGIFKCDTGQRLNELRLAVGCTDAPAAARIAHAIKGSAANLGAHIVVRICAEIETGAEAADLGAVPPLLDELQHEFTRACDALTAKLTAPEPCAS